MLQKVDLQDMSQQYHNELNQLLMNSINVFRMSFSSSSPAKVAPLVVNCLDDGNPVRVRLKNYSIEQEDFLPRFVTRVVDAGMAHSGHAASCACAPLLELNEGSSMFPFVADLRPVNRITVKSQCPTPNIERDLRKLSFSRILRKIQFCLTDTGSYRFSECCQESQSFTTPVKFTRQLEYCMEQLTLLCVFNLL